MLGGMIAASLAGVGLPLPLSALIAVSATSIVGAMVWLVFVYPRSHESPILLIMLTLGASVVIRGLAFILWGWDSKSLPSFLPAEAISISRITIFSQSILVFVAAVTTVVGLFVFFGYTMLGRAMQACADDHKGASLIGIRFESMGLSAFILTSALGGLAGVVITPLTTTAYDIGIPLAIKGFLSALVGGLNKTEGVILGGFTLGLLEALSAGFISSGLRDAIALGIFVLLLVSRPQGLIGGIEAGRI